MERAIPILPAEDLRVARDFYAAALGFDVLWEATEDGRTGIVGFRRGTLQITLDCPMEGHGRNACVSFEVEDADAYYEQWSRKVEVPRPPTDQPWGARTFDFADPFGNTIFVIGRRTPEPGVRKPVRPRFSDATVADAAAIAALRNAAAGALTARHGEGRWSDLVSERGAELDLRHARVRIGRSGKRILTVLRLARKKPWAIDVSYFTPVARPLYLTQLAVGVEWQGRGLGRQALADACAVAVAWPADAIRLDAWDAPAGAGAFYASCGFEERGRVVYKGSPLVYFERLLG